MSTDVTTREEIHAIQPPHGEEPAHEASRGGGAVTRIAAPIPLGLLAAMLAIFAFTNPLALFTAELPPIESLSVQRIAVTDEGFRLEVINGGPQPVTIAQVLVDDAYWNFTIAPSATLL